MTINLKSKPPRWDDKTWLERIKPSFQHGPFNTVQGTIEILSNAIKSAKGE